MIRLIIFILIIILHSCCLTQSKSYDEIQLSTYTDSSYLQLFVTSDSIIILQLERRDCDGYGDCKYGPKYYAQVFKQNQIFRLVNEEAQRILSDTFQLDRIKITHASSSNLKFLFHDSLIKDFRYYGSETNSKDIVELERQLLKAIKQSKRSNFDPIKKLIDISDLVDIDSIRINKLKPFEFDGYDGKRINYIHDYELKTITQKNQIDTIINIIQNLKILDSTASKMSRKLVPKYEISFYRNKLICFKLETDLVLMPYSWLQVLKVDSLLIRYFK